VNRWLLVLAAVGLATAAIVMRCAVRGESPTATTTTTAPESPPPPATATPPPVVEPAPVVDAALHSRDELLGNLRMSGLGEEPWAGQASALFRAIATPPTRVEIVGCYVAGCGAVLTFASLEAYRAQLAKIEQSDVYRAWTGGKQLAEPEPRGDGRVDVALVLFRPD
jgi:hypothetical protein